MSPNGWLLMPGLYRIFDTTLHCDFPLPELPRATGGDCSLSVTMGKGDLDQFETQGFERAFEWLGYNESVVCWVERKGDDYLFVFPGNSTFHISSDRLISC